MTKNIVSCDESVSKGDRTRVSILETAVDVASTEGLEGLSIGRLATILTMSKSGLFAHFGSKRDLQLATLDMARSIFIREVVVPAIQSGEGIELLWQLCESWFAYLKRGVFRGGCFFVAAASEFDGRPGPVADRIGEIMNEWLCALETRVKAAISAGHLKPVVDAAQLAFEINALELGANLSYQLFEDLNALDRGRQGVLERLRSCATAAGQRMLPRSLVT